MINKVLPTQGLPGTKATSGVAGVSDFLSSDPVAKDSMSLKDSSRTTADLKSNSTRSSDTSSSRRTTKEETFKKSLNTAISEKKSETGGVNKPGRPTIRENQAELEIDEIESNSTSVGAAAGLDTIQNSVAPEKESELPEASNGELQAVMKFMNSMENEFGISARELVSAMAMMADQSAQAQNAQTPILGSANSLSQTQVFQKLGLEGGQIRRAEYLYQSMLKEMAQNSMSSYLKEQDQHASIQVLSPTELRRKELNQSLERMNQSFFMNDTRPPYGKVPSQTEAMAPSNLQSSKLASHAENQVDSEVLGGAGAFAIPQGMELVESQQLAPESISARNTQEIDANNNSSDKTGGLPLAGLMSQVPTSGSSSQSDFDTSSGDSKSSQMSDLFQAKASSEGEASIDMNTQVSGAVGAKPDLAKISAESFSLTAPVNDVRSVEGRPEDAANVKNIIQSAQVLLRQGGGEMKVQMSPEGLGQVDLKVAVNEGKVDIQILADTADTKRLLEKGMGDLKASLAGHRLEVNNVKVDVSQNTDRDLNQNNGDLSREQARHFMGQFREDREAMRSFGDIPRMRSYKPSVASQITPDTGKETTEPAAKNSSRLNVIA